MQRTAIFTSAGASKAFGPLTGEIFPRIKKRLSEKTAFQRTAWIGRLPNEAKKNAELLEFLSGLLPGFTDPRIEPPLSPTFCRSSTTRSSQAQPRFRVTPAKDLLHFRQLLQEAVARAIHGDYDPCEPQELLSRLAQWIADQGNKSDRDVALISTNYDIAIDDLLYDLYDTD